MKANLCLLFTFFAIFISISASSITLKTGEQISGISISGYTKYLGIPYAQPPVGNLRWTSPQPTTIPSNYQATSFKPACPQIESDGIPSDDYSEDCLYLNIWVPSGVESGDGIPVMLYIHGGGWESGSGSLPLYWGDFISNSTSTIIVTFNYRLGSLGFLVSPVLGGNYGFEDQRAVLQWVSENIQSFGGDPNNVMLFGQSAGGMSVAGHLTSPPSFGYFSKAISHSGPPVITFRTQEESYYFSNEFANHLGCANSSDVDCMRGMNITQIIDAQRKVKPNTSLPWLLNNFLIWMPVVDNVNIMGSSQDLLNDGKSAPNVDMIWGSTRNETAGWVIDFLPSVPILVSEYKILLSNFFGSNSQAVFNEYPANSPSQVRDSLSMLSTDWVFTCSQKHSAKAMATNPNGGLLRNFVFLHPPSSDPRDTGTVAHCADIQEVCHGAELDYIFHSAAFSNATFTADEEELSWNCLNIWTSYADGTLTTEFWPTYELSEDNSLAIDLGSIEMQNDYRSSYCDFWESLNVESGSARLNETHKETERWYPFLYLCLSHMVLGNKGKRKEGEEERVLVDMNKSNRQEEMEIFSGRNGIEEMEE